MTKSFISYSLAHGLLADLRDIVETKHKTNESIQQIADRFRVI